LRIDKGRACPSNAPGLGIEWDGGEIEKRAKARHVIE